MEWCGKGVEGKLCNQDDWGQWVTGGSHCEGEMVGEQGTQVAQQEV